MDPNWLSAVSLLGACGGNGVRVGSYRISSEFLRSMVPHFLMSYIRLREKSRLQGYIFTLCLFTCLPSLTQLSFWRQRHKEVNTFTTANSTADLILPDNDDDYIIYIQTLSEGGLGPASDPIRIHRLSKLFLFIFYRVKKGDRGALHVCLLLL